MIVMVANRPVGDGNDRAQLMTFSIDPWIHLKESHRTLRDGSFGVVLSQALRARLRSHRPG